MDGGGGASTGGVFTVSGRLGQPDAGTMSGGNASGQSFAAGCRAKANHHGSFVWVDGAEADFESSRDNEFAIRASGGVRVVGGPVKATGGLIIETRDKDPDEPVTGQMWLIKCMEQLFLDLSRA